jgi:hypothetical protein
MNFANVKETAIRTISMAGLKVKKYSPEILVGVGIVSAIGSTVVACRSTLKVDEVLDKSKNDIHKIKKAKEEFGETGQYSEDDYRKDMTIVYTKAGISLVKLYAPSVALGIFSIGCLISSHNIMQSRNIAYAGAYAAVEQAYAKYRNAVAEKIGTEAENKIYNDIHEEKYETAIVDENGKEKKIKQKVDVGDPTNYDFYSRCFDESCPEFVKGDPEHNKYYLLTMQNWANARLRARGYLFLNEVYDALGMQPSKVGQFVGWIYDPENNTKGDNYVDFGMFDLHDAKKRDFVNGYEPAIWLHFNVDGDIMEALG